MERYAFLGGKLAPAASLRADEIGHHRVAMPLGAAERPAGDGPDMVLELADGAGVDGPMPRIVNPRCDLVDEEGGRRRAPLEHLHAKHSDMTERLGDAAGDLSRLVGAAGID